MYVLYVCAQGHGRRSSQDAKINAKHGGLASVTNWFGKLGDKIENKLGDAIGISHGSSIVAAKRRDLFKHHDGRKQLARMVRLCCCLSR